MLFKAIKSIPYFRWGHALIVLLLSFAFMQQLLKVSSGENRCVASYDGFGYYLYLAALTDQGTLDVDKEWAQKLQDRYCNGTEVYQLIQRDNGHYLNVYHMGLSVVLAPSFMIGHVWAVAGDYPTDGMSFPYHFMYILNAWLFVFLGWYYLRKLLLLFCSEQATFWITLLLLFGTNYLITSVMMYMLQHGYVFTLVAAFLYYLLRYRKDGSYRFVAPVLLGLIVLIRPSHLVLGLLPILLLYDRNKGVRSWIVQLLPYLIAGFLIQIPQLLYWRLIGGHWIESNLHVEEVILFDAHFSDFLFSFRKGWLLYTPFFLLLPFGFWMLYKKDRRLFYAALVTSFMSIWVMAGWECWWYASSFGQRPVVDIYPLLILPIALLLTSLRKQHWRFILYTFAGLCLLLNVFQSEQFRRGIIANDRMTEDQYWAVLGELDASKVNPFRLRVNEMDPDWTKQYQKYLDLGYRFEKKVLLNSDQMITCPANEDWGFDHITLMEHLATDETELKADFAWEVADTTGSVTLRMELANKHNVYLWNTIELALNKPRSDSATFSFTLPTLHHSYDYLQVYLVNRSGKEIRLKRFQLTATSLIRD